MATVFFNVGDYTATLYQSTASTPATVVRVIPQGEVHTIPDSFVPAEHPWLSPTYHVIRIVPNGEDDITGVSTDPAETIEHGALGLPENARNWYWREWDSNADYIVDVTVDGGAIINPAPYNRVYVVDAEIIAEFGSVSAFVVNGDGTYNELFNNTDYIVALLNIPFKLPDEVVGDEETVILGKVDTEILAPKVDTDIIRVPIGEIEVSGLQNNSIDYLATEYVLVLPYILETITLEPEWVIGKTISVEYLIDSYSGGLTVNVFNGEDYPVTSISSSIGRMIPFKTLLTNPTETGASMGAFNDTFCAYIRVSRNEVTEGEFSNLVSVEGTIAGQLGYVEVENIELDVNALASEKAMIVQALSGGVIIK